MIDNNNIEELRSNQLEIMAVVVSLCKKHEISYSLIGGSLLGAIRNGGFIPWDDDFDIGMLRPDFERFKEVAVSELPGLYFLQTNETDPEYPQNFAKIRKKQTLFVEACTEKLRMNHGIFIDIFPYDNVPKSKFKRFFHAKIILLFKRLANAKNNQYNFTFNRPFRLIGYLILKFFSLFLSTKNIITQQNKITQAFIHSEVEFVSNMGGGYTYFKQMIPKQLFSKLTKLPFEGEFYYAFSNYKIYLNNLFGDYMVLPPLNERKFTRHNVKRISFDTNDLKNNNI